MCDNELNEEEKKQKNKMDFYTLYFNQRAKPIIYRLRIRFT